MRGPNALAAVTMDATASAASPVTTNHLVAFFVIAHLLGLPGCAAGQRRTLQRDVTLGGHAVGGLRAVSHVPLGPVEPNVMRSAGSRPSFPRHPDPPPAPVQPCSTCAPGQ